jgi:hypothetical protein
MIRIVKEGAKPIKRIPPGAPENVPQNCYWETDTVEIDIDEAPPEVKKWLAEKLGVHHE